MWIFSLFSQLITRTRPTRQRTRSVSTTRSWASLTKTANGANRTLTAAEATFGWWPTLFPFSATQMDPTSSSKYSQPALLLFRVLLCQVSYYKPTVPVRQRHGSLLRKEDSPWKKNKYGNGNITLATEETIWLARRSSFVNLVAHTCVRRDLAEWKRRELRRWHDAQRRRRKKKMRRVEKKGQTIDWGWKGA